MKVDLGIMCRGIGTCYIELLVSGIDENCDFVVSGQTSDGNHLPLQQYEGKLKKSGEHQVVCVVPYLQTEGITLTCREFGNQGVIAAECTQTISYAQIKWASRYNYRLRTARAFQVRDVCDRLDYQYIQIMPEYFIRDGSERRLTNPEHIFKALAVIPENDNPVSIRLLNERGDTLQEQIIQPKDLHGIYPEELWGQEVYEAGFTLRIPNDGKIYCVVAEGGSAGHGDFITIDDESRGWLTIKHESPFYLAAQDKYYRQSLQRGLQRSQPKALISNADIDAGLFSVVVPLYKTPLQFLKEMIESVINQAYSNWELVLVNASPEDDEIARTIASYNDDRIRVLEVSENKGIAENTNVGIAVAKGSYIFLLDHDDFIDPWALYEYAKAIVEDPTLDILYCDEDLYNEAVGYSTPYFKSDFNIDLLRCHNYITHFLAMRSSLMKKLMLNPAFDAAQDYDLVLRAVEETQSVKHISHILYHWRMHEQSTSINHDSKPEANEHGRLALQAHLDRCGIKAQVQTTQYPCAYDVIYEVEGKPLVSIVIPNKDNADVLKRCIDSIEEKSTYREYEIIVIENNSVEPETFETYKALEQNYPQVKVVTWEHEFNYSKINNFGVQYTKGEYLLLLNNDVEVISPRWLESMLSICQRPDVGIVGAKLLYPDNTVQHAGVVMMCCPNPTVVGGPAHIFSNLDRDDPGYYNRAIYRQDLSAVTGACLMTKRALYDEIGGMDETLAVAYNDVDYCLRVREKGLLVVFDADSLLYHYESLTRGGDTMTAGMNSYTRFTSEQSILRSRWSRYYTEGDPYHGRYATIVPKLDTMRTD